MASSNAGNPTKAITYVLPLDGTELGVEAGGKGRSLARLVAAGLPVPPGFVVATAAYAAFVAANRLDDVIEARLEEVAWDDAESVAHASASIRAAFARGHVPDAIRTAVATAQADPAAPVAVRSSATAEDLPELSFAGQHDSYLDVRGDAALLDAVRSCWGSLWSDRALAYRHGMGVEHRAVGMAVVVMTMIDADAAGIVFTRDPAAPDRDRLVVNASYGLGAAVVDGAVDADTYTLDRTTLEVTQARIGAKERAVVATGRGTATRDVPAGRKRTPALTAERLADVARLALAAEAVFGTPQDVEFAVRGEACWLLQARPITRAAAPVARWEPPSGTAKLVRRQVVENMPQPLSPLFEDLYLTAGLDAGLSALMADLEIPLNLDDFIRRPLFVTVNGYGYCRYEFTWGWRFVARLPKVLLWYATALPRMLKSLVPRWRDEGLPGYRDTIRREAARAPAVLSEGELVEGIRALALADARYWFYVTMVVGAAKVSESVLDRFVRAWVPGDLDAADLLTGFDSATLRGQLELEAIARRLRADPVLAKRVCADRPAALLERLGTAADGREIAAAIESHLDVFGQRIYNLDFVEPTQREAPAAVLGALHALVCAPSRDTAARRREMARRRDARVDRARARLGPVRRRLFDRLLAWARQFGPHREEALFHMGAAWPTLRALALELGDRLAAVGALHRADDVFFLVGHELDAAAAAPAAAAAAGFAGRAAGRRTLRDARMQLHPPARVPEDLRFTVGPFDLTRLFEVWETQKRNPVDARTLTGFAVSPGRVAATATVIHTPEDFATMRPGTVLVCPTTTPAWTPLFTAAVALVTDIGGPLAHGSIVAREYGIPAVLGTGNATRRVVTGDRVEVDGNAGTIRLLDVRP